MFSGAWCGSLGVTGWLVMLLFWLAFLGLAGWAIASLAPRRRSRPAAPAERPRERI